MKARKLTQSNTRSKSTSNLDVVCPAQRGDIIAMHPLILHASSQVKEPKNRRVLHIEYSNAQLPNGLTWYHS
ncbi:MAG: hypothetical protein SFY67_17220 [Candidatus Melainabacteria bacterium]|nr:hypothetical protein [Candidatus Melainabacteria bacterium]